MQNLTAQQLAQQLNVKFVNSTAKNAFYTKNDVALQNAVNAKNFTKKQKQLAQQLLTQYSTLLNATAYINMRKHFIAVKLANCIYKLTAKKLKQLLATAQQHNVQLVITNTNSIIMRIK